MRLDPKGCFDRFGAGGSPMRNAVFVPAAAHFLLFALQADAGSTTSLQVAVTGLARATAPVAASSSTARRDATIGWVDFRDGLLSVDVRDWPWRKVLEEVSRKSGIRHQLYIDGDNTVTVSFRKLPVEQAFQRLFAPGAAAFVFLYAGDRRSSGSHRGASEFPAEIWILPGGQPASAALGARADSPSQATRFLSETNKAPTAEESELAQQLSEIQTTAEETNLAAPRLLAALDHASPQIRLTAIESLGNLAEDSAVAALTRLMGTDAVDDVRANAAAALARIGSSRALRALSQALKGNDVLVRRSAVAALAQNGGEQSLELVRATLNDEDEEVSRIAAEALEEFERRDQ